MDDDAVRGIDVTTTTPKFALKHTFTPQRGTFCGPTEVEGQLLITNDWYRVNAAGLLGLNRLLAVRLNVFVVEAEPNAVTLEQPDLLWTLRFKATGPIGLLLSPEVQ